VLDGDSTLTNTPHAPAGIPERPIYINGIQYLTNTHPAFHRPCVAQSGIYRVDENNVAYPVAGIGQVSEWKDLSGKDWTMWNELKRPDIMALLPAVPYHDIIFTWSDLNDNRKIDVDEVKFKVFASGLNNSRFMLSHDLSATNAAGLHFDAPAINENGVPIYDLNSGKYLCPKLPTAVLHQGPMSYIAHAEEPLYTRDGTFIFTGFPVLAFKNGKQAWRYDALGETGPPKMPGDMVNHRRILGLTAIPPEGETGEIWAVNAEYGSIYLLTTDGLFITELGGDERNTPLWRMKTWQRGMEIKNVSFETESFWPGFCQCTEDGKIYVVVGKEHSTILRLDGFETARRLEPVSFEVTSGDLSNLPAVVVPFTEAQTSIMYIGLRKSPPTIDGNLADWDSSLFVPVDNRASAGMMVSGENLYAAYRTTTPDLLVNGGGQNGDIGTIFKTGGALDLFFATANMTVDRLSNEWRSRIDPVEGDLRLLVTKVNNATKAVLFRPVVPGTPENERIVYHSDIAHTVIDRVTDISTQVSLTASGGNFEFAVPLQALGLSQTAIIDRLNTMGDIGVLRGNTGQTVERVYWRNKNTLLTSDIPSEAKFQPNRWGLLRFKQVADVGVGASNRQIIPNAGPAGLRCMKDALVARNPYGKQITVRVIAPNGRMMLSKVPQNGEVRVPIRGRIGIGVAFYEIRENSVESARGKVLVGM
jgi:hypothetical protein